MLSLSLWDVGVWGMENGGGEKREQKGCGITDSAYTVTIPSKTCLSSTRISSTKSQSPCYMSPCHSIFFLVNGYPSMDASELQSVGIL